MQNKVRFQDEFKEFIAFVRQPRLLPKKNFESGLSAWNHDWTLPIPMGRIFRWACFLWLFNLFLVAPLTMWAVSVSGAESKFNLDKINYLALAAVFWAPIFEEMLFRFGLRRPFMLCWLLPILITVFFIGLNVFSVLLLAGVFLSFYLLNRFKLTTKPALAWPYRKLYVRYFPWVFHVSVLIFAAMHIGNYKLGQSPLWLLPLFVLPQWITGLVLGWVRVKGSILNAMLLHSIFNAGPIFIALITVKLMTMQGIDPSTLFILPYIVK